MLGLFRRFSKSPVGIAIFALILLAFVIGLYEAKSGFDVGSIVSGGGVATVGGESIDETELARRVKNQLDGERQRDPSTDIAKFIAAGGVEKTVDLTATGRAKAIPHYSTPKRCRSG